MLAYHDKKMIDDVWIINQRYCGVSLKANDDVLTPSKNTNPLFGIYYLSYSRMLLSDLIESKMLEGQSLRSCMYFDTGK